MTVTDPMTVLGVGAYGGSASASAPTAGSRSDASPWTAAPTSRARASGTLVRDGGADGYGYIGTPGTYAHMGVVMTVAVNERSRAESVHAGAFHASAPVGHHA